MYTFAKFQTVGRLTQDAKLPDNDKAPVFMIVAVNDGYKDKETGKWVERTNFIPVQAFHPSIKKAVADGHMKKGRAFMFEGRIEQNQWTDEKTGEKRQCPQLIHDGPVRFMDNKKD